MSGSAQPLQSSLPTWFLSRRGCINSSPQRTALIMAVCSVWPMVKPGAPHSLLLIMISVAASSDHATPHLGTVSPRTTDAPSDAVIPSAAHHSPRIAHGQTITYSVMPLPPLVPTCPTTSATCTSVLQNALATCRDVTVTMRDAGLPWVTDPLFVTCSNQRVRLFSGVVIEVSVAHEQRCLCFTDEPYEFVHWATA